MEMVVWVGKFIFNVLVNDQNHVLIYAAFLN